MTEVDSQSGAAGRGRRRLVLGAVVAVVAVAAVVVVALTRGSSAPAVGPGAAVPRVERDPGLPADALANAAVRDGDRVRATGSLVAKPGRQPVFCGTNLLGPHTSPQGGRPADPDCRDPMAVPVSGVDLGRLRHVVTFGTTRITTVRLIAVWHEGRSMTATSVTEIDPEEPDSIPEPKTSRIRYTPAQQHAAEQGVQDLERHEPALGMFFSGTSNRSPRLQVGGLVVDSRVYAMFSPLDRPAGILCFTSSILPLD